MTFEDDIDDPFWVPSDEIETLDFPDDDLPDDEDDHQFFNPHNL